MSPVRLILPLLPLLIASAAAQSLDDWDRFTPGDADSTLVSESVLAADSAGGIWAGGHYQGIDHFDGTGWTHELDHEWIMALATDRQGRVWAFSNGELRRRDSSGWKSIGTAGFNEVYYIAISGSGAVWTLLEPGLVPFTITQVIADMYNGTRWISTKLPFDRGPSALAVADGDTVWIGTRGKGLYRLKGTQIMNITSDGGTIPSDTITRLATGVDGDLWIGTNRGLVRYRNGAWDRIDAGLPLPLVREIAVERGGAVWVYTGAYDDPAVPQLVRFDGLARTHTLALPFPRARISGLAVDAAGHPWLSVQGLGMVRYRPSVASSVRETVASGIAVEVRPNPFSGSLEIAVDLPAAANVAIDIVDMRGEAVCRLADGALPSGRYTTVWNGRDMSGAPAADGLYRARVRIGGVVRGMMLVKMGG